VREELVSAEFGFSVSVVIPVYNGAATVGEVVERTREVLGPLVEGLEFVLVNDGSADDSWGRIKELCAGPGDVRGVDLSRNFGQHNALLAGIRQARHEVIVTIDDDLQNPPAEIPKLLARLGEDCDVVYGKPVEKRQAAPRRLATQVVVGALRALGGRTAPMVSSFRAFRTELREGFEDYTGPDVSIDGLLTWRTEKFCSVTVTHDPRRHGESNYSTVDLVRHALTMITAFSTRPLRIAATLGFFVTLFGAAVFLYVLVALFVSGRSVPGFAFLASIISIFAGAQLFSLGVIGEYLARIHVRVMARPSYTIRAMTGTGGAVAWLEPDPAPAPRDSELGRLLAWDTEFWGFPVGRVEQRELDRRAAAAAARWADSNEVQCTFLLAAAEDAETAEAAQGVGFSPVDTRVTLEHNGAAPSPAGPTEGIAIRPGTVADEPKLTEIARRAHTDTRFFFDPGFAPERAAEMYAAWVRRALDEEERTVLVAESAGEAVGYVLLEADPFRIDLIAVEEAARGRGIGRALVEAALGASPNGRTEVVTQARNVGALRLYEAAGFRVKAAEVWYHRWA
jgi:glycosyltransferase involved in cell wall biosynthesis/ribosomal protein S18 acetylase RimI-like enzyme